MSTDDDARDLLGAYALDAVDDMERRVVERLVERDPAAARELAEMRATAAMLGAAASAAPPAGLRVDVLARIRATPQAAAPSSGDRPAGAVPTSGTVPTTGAVPPAGTVPTAGQPAPPTSLADRRPRRTTTWLAIAATALGAAAIPTALALQQAQQTQQVEAQAQELADLLADPDARVVRAGVAGGGTAVGVLSDDRALFTATGLSEPDEGRVYQLWVLRDGVPVPDAVMPAEDGRVRALTEDYRAGDLLAVTVEPEGGSATPTTDPVVVLDATEA